MPCRTNTVARGKRQNEEKIATEERCVTIAKGTGRSGQSDTGEEDKASRGAQRNARDQRRPPQSRSRVESRSRGGRDNRMKGLGGISEMRYMTSKDTSNEPKVQNVVAGEAKRK